MNHRKIHHTEQVLHNPTDRTKCRYDWLEMAVTKSRERKAIGTTSVDSAYLKIKSVYLSLSFFSLLSQALVHL